MAAILVVGDEAIRQTIRAQLENDGHTVYQAFDGRPRWRWSNSTTRAAHPD
jgi:CheY-like chemotaxis protein